MPELVGAVDGILRRLARRVGSALSRGVEWPGVGNLGEMLVGEGLDVRNLCRLFSWGWWLWLLLLLFLVLVWFGRIVVAYTWRSWNRCGSLTFRDGCRIRVVALMGAMMVIWLLRLAVGI